MSIILRSSPINPAEILWLIREKKVETLSDLYQYYRVSLNVYVTQSPEFTTKYSITQAITQLERAGLIETEEFDSTETDHQHSEIILKPTTLITEVQTALNLSLSELARWNADCIMAKPMFGAPDKNFIKVHIFVLMPFSDELQPVYEDHIKKVAKLLEDKSESGEKISISRADDFFNSQSIISDIWNSIYNSKVLIADCTGRNPNVFYEIGIAHAIGKQVILISQSINDVPFDLKHLRYIIYDFTPRGMLRFEELLFRSLEFELLNN